MYCLSGTLPCGDFMYVIMGDVLFEWDTSICVDFVYVTIWGGDVLFEWDTSMCWFHGCYHEGCTVWVGHFHVLVSCMLPWGMYYLSGTFHVLISCMLPWGMSCLNGALPCVDFMDVIMGDGEYNPILGHKQALVRMNFNFCMISVDLYTSYIISHSLFIN